MDTSNQVTNQAVSEQDYVWKLSWITYVPHALIALVIFHQIFFGGEYSKMILVKALFSVVLLNSAYQSYYLSTVRLFANKKGVWVFRGVFPWSRGTYGVNWRDLEDCLGSMGFIYWITNSTPVYLRPRFSQNPTITVPSIHRGKEAVAIINELSGQYRSANPM
jgi:hypothetical protein